MALELTVPQVGESITEVQIGQWHRREGEAVAQGDILVEIETDKVTVELPAPAAGTLGMLLKRSGEAAQVGEVIGYLEEGGTATAEGVQTAKPPVVVWQAEHLGDAAKAPAPAKKSQSASLPGRQKAAPPAPAVPAVPEPPRGRVEAPVASPAPERPSVAAASAELSDASPDSDLSRPETPAHLPRGGDRQQQVVPMSPLRRRIAERLVQAQQTAALLTTFNEVDMSAVMALRARHQDAFVQRHQIKLGLMSFFVKATIDALKRFPQLNAEVRGTDIVFRDYYDVGVAVSTEKGLVVPVLAGAERMSFAEIELAVADFATRARDHKLKLSELEGGTFTITNGGVFGSLLSTPIINPPQSGILGLHAIQDRPVARDGQVVIRPMMYVALTYDHRIVDGREAVSFLRRIKEVVEEPARLLVEI